MAYTTPADVRVALSPGGDPTDTGSAAGMTDADLNAAIAEATTEINARLSSRYTVPFTDPAPAIVAQVTKDIAAYLATLTDRRGDPIPPGDPVALRYARAQTLLGQLSSGQAIIDVPGPQAITGPNAIANPYDGDLFQLGDAGIGPARFPGNSRVTLSSDPLAGW